MPNINYWAVIVAAITSFVVGAVWYSPLLFGKPYMELRGMTPGALAELRMPVWKVLAEFARGLVVAYVLARFVVLLGVGGWQSAAQLGLWLWLGFYATLYVGAVIHENMPWRLYAIHVGDGLVKILLMAVVLGVWQR